ncbi:hypothetical protein CAPN010_16620 [Capnocytophaga cynodegmi]|uniref:hypothetical protein n=1 Tax=Capnocytophaga cynodegmi TaxID=28189 RepID=UPI001EE335BF|nr:hypothetical protein [Capnocytophaga cynodegmi]GJQ07504.1 hypothetical protein CAPN010_16620 [Capnocytophaga cynodegmi]
MENIKTGEFSLITKIKRDGKECIAQVALSKEQHKMLQVFLIGLSQQNDLVILPRELDLKLKEE